MNFSIKSQNFAFFLFLFCILFLFLSIGLGERPFATPDEGRYVEIPREMVLNGDYVTPRLNGIKYFEKPPLLYWLQATNIKFLGLTEAAMRLWIVFFATLGCLATYIAGKRFFDHKTGFIAALILATMPLYYALGRLIILDMPISVLVTLSLYLFYTCVHTPPSLKRRLLAYGFYTASALGVLTKGLMALAVPGPIILIWAIFTKQWRSLWPAYLPSGIAVFLLIAAPWHILASIKNPEFAYKYFIVEHFLRFTTTIHMRYQPVWFFIPIILIGIFPWSFLLFTKKQEKSPHNTFLLIWVLWTFAFFSVSKSKLIPYILPCLPPLSLLIAQKWDILKEKTCTLFGISVVLIGASGLGILFIKPQFLAEKAIIYPYLKVLFSMLMGIGLMALVTRHNAMLSRYSIPATAISIIFILIPISPHIQKTSAKEFAQIILKENPDAHVVSYKTYFQDLPVYLNKTISVAAYLGELEFGTTVEDTSSWMFSEERLLSLWKESTPIYVVARESEIKNLQERIPDFHYRLVAVNSPNVLIANH